jgi:hypothetical protein
MTKPSFMELEDLRRVLTVLVLAGGLVGSMAATSTAARASEPPPVQVPVWQQYRDLEGMKSRLWELEAGVAAIDARARVLHRLADVNLPGQGLDDQLPEQRRLLERAISSVDDQLALLGQGVGQTGARAKLAATLAGWSQVKQGWRGAVSRTRDIIGFRSVMELMQWNLASVRGNVRDLARQLGVQGLHEGTPDRMRPPPQALPPTPEL